MQTIFPDSNVTVANDTVTSRSSKNVAGPTQDDSTAVIMTPKTLILLVALALAFMVYRERKRHTRSDDSSFILGTNEVSSVNTSDWIVFSNEVAFPVAANEMENEFEVTHDL